MKSKPIHSGLVAEGGTLHIHRSDVPGDDVVGNISRRGDALRSKRQPAANRLDQVDVEGDGAS